MAAAAVVPVARGMTMRISATVAAATPSNGPPPWGAVVVVREGAGVVVEAEATSVEVVATVVAVVVIAAVVAAAFTASAMLYRPITATDAFLVPQSYRVPLMISKKSVARSGSDTAIADAAPIGPSVFGNCCAAGGTAEEKRIRIDWFAIARGAVAVPAAPPPESGPAEEGNVISTAGAAGAIVKLSALLSSGEVASMPFAVAVDWVMTR